MGFLLLGTPSILAAPGDTIPVSVGLPGFGPMGNSNNATVSETGRYVVFDSDAPDLILGDTNGKGDVFLFDAVSQSTVRLSLTAGGAEVMAKSSLPSISRDGQFVAFLSDGRLLPADDDGAADAYVLDRQSGNLTLASVTSFGGNSQRSVQTCSISPDGTFVAFNTQASDMVPGDTNNALDVFVRDLTLGTTELVSIGNPGQANGHSYQSSLSHGGRFICFSSIATNLVIGDTNDRQDVFLRDRLLGITSRISVSTSGTQGNGDCSRVSKISYDGRYVAFTSSSNNLVSGFPVVFVRDTLLGVTWSPHVSMTGEMENGGAGDISISGDGTHVAFYSTSANLVDAPQWPYSGDIYLRDLVHSLTKLISKRDYFVDDGYNYWPCELPELSGDGAIVVFSSRSNMLTHMDLNRRYDVFYSDANAPTPLKVSDAGVEEVLGDDQTSDPNISASGKNVLFTSLARNLILDNTNGYFQVYSRDLLTGEMQCMSVTPAGEPGNRNSGSGSMSPDGRFVLFTSESSDFVTGDTNGVADVFLRDTLVGTTELISVDSSGMQGNGVSGSAASDRTMSADGRYVAFWSNATNLIPGDTNGTTDIFLRDRFLGITSRVSISSFGIQANGNSDDYSVTPDGRFIAFRSTSTNLVTPSNTVAQIYVRDTGFGFTTCVSTNASGTQASSAAQQPSVSADGMYVAFSSGASNLVSGDTNSAIDVFVKNRIAGTVSRVSVNGSGQQGNSSSDSPCISESGQFVSFTSSASNLIPGDTNGQTDIFVRDLRNPSISIESMATDGSQALQASSQSVISPNGAFVAFRSLAANLSSHACRGQGDIFRRERAVASPSIQGDATLDGFEGNNYGHALVIQIWKDGLLAEEAGPLFGVDNSFGFSPSTTGDVLMKFRFRTGLWKSVALNLGAPITGLSIHMTNGDCDHDNEVGVGDYAVLSASYGSSEGDPLFSDHADLNGDLTVDIADYSILSQSYGAEGD